MLAGAAAAAEATARDSAEADMGDILLCSTMTATSDNGGEIDSGMLEGTPNIHKQQHVRSDSTYRDSVAAEAVLGGDSMSSTDHHLRQMVPEKQQVEQKQRFPTAVVDEAERINRPQEHFITIASNGEFSVVVSLLSLLSPVETYIVQIFAL